MTSVLFDVIYHVDSDFLVFRSWFVVYSFVFEGGVLVDFTDLGNLCISP